MLSNYARKQMLKKVASQFTDSDVTWLATQDEFNRICGSSEVYGDIVDLGKKLLKHKPVEKKFANTIAVPDIPVLK